MTETAEEPTTEAGEGSLGDLVKDASDQISTLVRSEIALAKAELRFDAKRVGMAGGLFAAAAFMGHLCLILGSFAIAYGLVALGVWEWAAFVAVTVFYLLVAGFLAFIGYRRLKGLKGMRGTARGMKAIMKGSQGGQEEVESGAQRAHT